jgi:hypothetical protein
LDASTFPNRSQKAQSFPIGRILRRIQQNTDVAALPVAESSSEDLEELDNSTELV